MKSAMPDLAIMIGKVKKKQGMEPDEEGKEEDKDESSDKEGVAQDFLDAVKSGDAGALLDAFQALMVLCKDEDY